MAVVLPIAIQKAVGGKAMTAQMTLQRAGPVSTPAGVRSAGFSAPNQAADVRKIQELLNLLGATQRPLSVNGTCDKALVDAILGIQRTVGVSRPDGQIDPAKGNNTLVRLNELAKPLVTQTAEHVSVFQHGGIRVRWSGKKPPAPYRMLLTIAGSGGLEFKTGQRVPAGRLGDFMEVTDRPGSDLLDKSNVADFLAIMERRKLWGKPGKVYLVVWRDEAVVSVSQPKSLDCPVQPWKKSLTPTAIGAGDDGPNLKYVGTGNNGSVLVPKKLNGAYFWKRDRVFVTKADDRGFDCITFVGSLYNVEAGAPYGSSAAMATELGASAVSWQNPNGDNIANGQAKGEVIKDYFDVAAHTGTYLLWHGSHIVLVVNKTVHEFSQSKGKYNSESAQSWMSDSRSYHLYALPAGKQF
jgi:hypothetical protein